jgi:hypothetical protein
MFEFLRRSTYPVFETLNLASRRGNPEGWALFTQANVNSVYILADTHDLEIDTGYYSPIIEALQDGTLRAPTIELRINVCRRDGELHVCTFQDLFHALSSTECPLKELLFLADISDSRITTLLFDEHMINMLRANTSLEILGIKCEDDSSGFLSMGILNAAAEHPRLRKLIFSPPVKLDPPPVRQSDPFNIWYRNNPLHEIVFECIRSEKWRDYVHFCRFGLLQQVSNERIRSHLLVAALSNHSSSPERIHFLLSENQDVFAK